jgi:hypothetical protein
MKDGTVVAEVEVYHGFPHLRVDESSDTTSSGTRKSDTALVSSKQLSIAIRALVGLVTS